MLDRSIDIATVIVAAITILASWVKITAISIICSFLVRGVTLPRAEHQEKEQDAKYEPLEDSFRRDPTRLYWL